MISSAEQREGKDVQKVAGFDVPAGDDTLPSPKKLNPNVAAGISSQSLGEEPKLREPEHPKASPLVKTSRWRTAGAKIKRILQANQ